MPDIDEFPFSIDDMKYTDQRDFFDCLLHVLYSENDILLDASIKPVTITKKDVIKALKKSLITDNQMNKIGMYLSTQNVIKFSKSHIESVKNLFKTGKMAENIQTLDNDSWSKAYHAFTLTSLENKLYAKIALFNDKQKKEIDNIKFSNNELINIFVDAYDPLDIKTHFTYLSSQLFSYKMVKPLEYVYDETKPNSNNEEVIADSFIEKDDVLRYANELKAFTDMMHKKPWYIRWFSEDYSRKMVALKNAREELYKRGIDKNALEKFLKSKGDETCQKIFYKETKNSLDSFNKNNKDKLEKVESIQEKINFDNFYKEQEFSDKAKKTLDKLVDPIEDKDYKEAFKKKREEVKDDKELCEFGLKSKMVSKADKEIMKEYIDYLDEDIKFVNKLEKERDAITEEVHKEDLRFNPKDVIDSSDDLQDKLDDEFENDQIEQTLNILNNKEAEEIKEKNI